MEIIRHCCYHFTKLTIFGKQERYKKDSRVESRLYLKEKDEDLHDNEIHCCWKEIVWVMDTQKVVTTTAQNKSDEVIIIHRCSEAGEKVRLIYDKLNYKHTPFTKKKSIVHKLEFQKLYPDIHERIRPG